MIDDLGRSLQDLKTLGSLGIDLTYAVLPFESRTPEVVAELRRRREEILCHLPMEPSNGANPGPGALRGSMSDEDLIAGTRKALAAVPGSVGVNNHMGSGLTTDILRMTAIVEVLKERRLFFLDSRTSAQSVGYKAAVEAGIPAAERQVFLDGDPAPEVIREQFRRTLEIARRRGAAVAIGHPYPETLAVLGEEVPRALQLGYDFVPVSFLLDRSGDLEE
ncbi:MAG: divergent polysaccharide deacetylase family protein [Deltaproteobacteria bacterium]|nr:divergent polysaccharide deacetylase family protein [Deltaproteobacteria bacterium]